ncbi:MAG TPA: TetR/AcrR family transcriptional regulator [Xanthobacteraceae bacterium]|nr:TetR/AcrR family transcriptional regulator [Xanthobacteraceae bacterium]
MRAPARSGRRARQEVARPQRGRILDAAFRAFMRDGFARTSTLAIASAANVSKRELYAQFGSKQALLGACINARAERMRAPARAAVIADRDGLVRTLIAFGAAILREASDPAVIGVFRLAITEARRSPRVAAMLNQAGRETNHVVLAGLLEQAQSLNLIARAAPRELAARFLALLWGDLLLRLLLRVAKRPTEAQAQARAALATQDFLKLYGRS